jgi:hypothetical protein
MDPVVGLAEQRKLISCDEGDAVLGSVPSTQYPVPASACLLIGGVYPSRLAFTRISTLPRRALDTGQPCSACPMASWKPSSSMPGTRA